MKLHLAVLHQTRPAGIGVFPMNDGVFVTSVESDELTSFVNGVMATLFREFLKHKDRPEHQFVVRGAIAYGPVSFGSDLAQGAPTLQNSSQYTSQIILGAPLAQAVDAERQAPPFGIYVHESARWFGTKPLKRVFHRWFAPGSTDASHVKQSLPKYFKWIKSRPVLSGYSPDRVAAAILLLDEYLLDV